jgi:hypothetical protein
MCVRLLGHGSEWKQDGQEAGDEVMRTAWHGRRPQRLMCDAPGGAGGTASCSIYAP